MKKKTYNVKRGIEKLINMLCKEFPIDRDDVEQEFTLVILLSEKEGKDPISEIHKKFYKLRRQFRNDRELFVQLNEFTDMPMDYETVLNASIDVGPEIRQFAEPQSKYYYYKSFKKLKGYFEI